MDPGRSETRLAAVIFTDIVGFSRTTASDQEKGRRIRRQHEELVRPLVEQYGGTWIERVGDETLSIYSSAIQAVDGALAIQAALKKDADFQIRIGIHLGDVTFDEDGVFGPGVNIASRVRPQAKPGGVAISREVHDTLQGRTHLEFGPPREVDTSPWPIVVFSVSGQAGPAQQRTRAAQVLAQPELRSIAVLPLENIGPSENEYLADGVTDALIESLAGIGPELRVISRASVMHYKGSRKTSGDVARELGVQYLIEGSAQRQNDRLLVRVQLIDAREDSHRWSQSYEREVRDFFTLQRQIAGMVAAEVDIALDPGRESRVAATRPVDREALDLYLRALSQRGPFMLVARWGPPTIELLERAVRLDPGFAEGWVRLADTYLTLAIGGMGSGSQRAFERAREATERALGIEERMGAAHAALGRVRLYYEWDFQGARTAFERAVELSPNDPDALNGLASYLLFIESGREPEAERLADRQRRVGPLDLYHRTLAMTGLFYTREYERGIEEAERIRELDPAFVDVNLGMLHLMAGRPEDFVREHLAWLASFGPAFAPASEAFRRGNEQGGWRGAVRAGRELNIQVANQGAFGLAYAIAFWSVLLGEADLAMTWLERAFEQRDPLLVIANVDPRLDPLRSDPRFQDLLRRIGFPGD